MNYLSGPGCQTTPSAIILKKQSVLELPRLSRPPFKGNSSSTPEASNVHHENLLCFQSLHNNNHGSKDDASRELRGKAELAIDMKILAFCGNPHALAVMLATIFCR